MSLNLLPTEYKNELIKKQMWQHWQKFFLTVVMVVVLSLSGLTIEHQWLANRDQQLRNQVEHLRTQTVGGQKENITSVTTALNSTISMIDKIMSNPRSWSHDLSQVLGIIPGAVTIQEVSLTAAGDLTLTGVAKTRSSFISLDQALKTSPLLTQVTTSATPATRDNLPFVYKATLVAPQP